MRRLNPNISPDQLKAKSSYRGKIETLRNRVSLLVGTDRLIMTMHLSNGNSYRQLARLIGVNEANIARRIRKITERLIEGEYIECLKNRDKLTKTQMAIARDYFLTGLSQKAIAAKRHTSFYNARETILKIKQIIKQK
ncbi:MAG: transposase family protein [Planctomycetes bacterium]|nr:transposase family protein [Planctomycetota bacterium]